MNTIQVKTKAPRFPVAPELYGLFFEEINRSGDGGLYAELLRNRSFEDSIPPERCTLLQDGFGFQTPEGWRDQFNNGEGLLRWKTTEQPTDIPAWYGRDAVLSLDYDHTLNANRRAALRVEFQPGGCVFNVGFKGIAVRKGVLYDFYVFAGSEKPCTLAVRLRSGKGECLAEGQITVSGREFRKYDLTLTAERGDAEATLEIASTESAAVAFGFTSLMPRDTYLGHGMRKDLMEMLKATHPAFLRFPGGCVVEGFTKETSTRFSRTIGPVWERPSHLIMWHYRTTNGIGFHEYLQICEDLEVSPMYVINCGITCQGRNAELFEGEELEEMLQEACNAIDYAIADPSENKWAALRAKAGHPAPFPLKYVEIGNENNQQPYYDRYPVFYKKLKERYPQLIYISNTHTEEQGLPTEFVDEHYYNSAEYFMKNSAYFDRYSRSKPSVFIGEYAVTCGADVANLRAALSEAAFLIGVENNQDIVRLCAYAPLFGNVSYAAWRPNLIEFDNRSAFGLPSYYALSMMAEKRGKTVVTVNSDFEKIVSRKKGRPGLVTNGYGVQLRNVTLNGTPVSVTHTMAGQTVTHDGVIESVAGKKSYMENFPGFAHSLKKYTFAAMGEEDVEETVYEGELCIPEPGMEVSLTLWNYNSPMLTRLDETMPENPEWAPDAVDYCAWTFKGGKSSVGSVHWFYEQPLDESKAVEIPCGEFCKFRIVSRPDGFDCYLNGEKIHSACYEKFSNMAVTASDNESEVIVKLVNFDEAPVDLVIRLDCDVCGEYEVTRLDSASSQDTNSLAAPKTVTPHSERLSGASREFVYHAAAHSLDILTLKKA